MTNFALWVVAEFAIIASDIPEGLELLKTLLGLVAFRVRYFVHFFSHWNSICD